MIFFLAANPEAGDIMAETGGGRKLRWKAQGRGKRGGVSDAMKKTKTIRVQKHSAGSRIIASLREAVDWVEGKDVPVRVSTVEAPTTAEIPNIDVRETRRHLGLSQAAFAAKFGFQPATLRNWEQGRTRPDGPARVLLAVIARHPEAVEDALRKAS